MVSSKLVWAALAALAPCAGFAQVPPAAEAGSEPPAAAQPADLPPPAAEAQSPAAAETRPSVAWTTRNPAGFLAMTPGKAAFGVAGTMAMIGSGDQIVKENLMTEPAGALSRELARVVAERTGAVVGPDAVPATALKPEQIAAGAKGARYVVDVTTIGWGYAYQPLKWTAFNATYFARLQLVDGATGKLLLKDNCAWPRKGQSTTTGQSELLADHARELKLRIMAGTLACRSQFLAKIDQLKL